PPPTSTLSLHDALPISRPAQGLAIKLEFLKPFASMALTRFDFAQRTGGTLVTWTMEGNNDFVGKAFCLVTNMDKMVGGDFERGLDRKSTRLNSSHDQIS